MADGKSEGGFSASDSQSSMQSILHLDVETLKLGTEHVLPLILENIVMLFIPSVFQRMVESLELSSIIKFCGTGALNEYALAQPLAFLFTIAIPKAIAVAANEYIEKNISKQQLVAAEVYLAHYMIMSLVIILIAIVLYFIFFKDLVKGEIAGSFLMFRIVIGSIVNTFGHSLDCFFESENRDFILISKNLIFCCIYSIVLQVCYINSEKLGISMTNAGIAYVVAAAYAMVQMFMVITRIPFIDTQYKGILKFQMKKLSPIRWKILLQILVHGIQNLLIICSQQIIYFEMAMLNKFLIKQDDILFVQNMKLLSYENFMQYALMVNEIFQSSFNKLVTYNIGIKKITRIWEIIKWTLILHCGIGLPLIIIYAPIASKFTFLLFPALEKNTVFQYALSEVGNTPMLGVIAQILRQPHYLVTVIMIAEGKGHLATLIQMPAFIFVAVYSGFLFYEVKDNAPFTMIMCLGEISNFILGWGFMVFYIIKYRQLFLLNKKNAEKQTKNDEESQLALRKTVVEQLAVGVEHKKNHRKTLATLFDRQASLAQNDNFFSLRDSLIKVRPESVLVDRPALESVPEDGELQNNSNILKDDSINTSHNKSSSGEKKTRK